MLGGAFIGGSKAEAEAEAALAAALQEAGFVVVVPELPGAAGVNGGDSATTVSLERECANFSHCYNASLFSLRVAAVSARCVVPLPNIQRRPVCLTVCPSHSDGGWRWLVRGSIDRHSQGSRTRACMLVGLGATQAALAAAVCAMR
jgi:hypothetical protein